MYDAPNRVIPSAIEDLIWSAVYDGVTIGRALMGRVTMSDLCADSNAVFLFHLVEFLTERDRMKEHYALLRWIGDYQDSGIDILLPASPRWGSMSPDEKANALVGRS